MTLPGPGDYENSPPTNHPHDPRNVYICDVCDDDCSKCDLFTKEPDGDQYEERKLRDE